MGDNINIDFIESYLCVCVCVLISGLLIVDIINFSLTIAESRSF